MTSELRPRLTLREIAATLAAAVEVIRAQDSELCYLRRVHRAAEAYIDAWVVGDTPERNAERVKERRQALRAAIDDRGEQ